MDQLIIQFAVGLFGGTAAGLFASMRTRKARVRQRKRGQSRTGRANSQSKKNRTGTVKESLDGRNLSIETLPPSNVFRQPGINPQTPANLSQPVPPASFSVCPSCGLESPPLLMLEHFQGSPSHKLGPRSSILAVQEGRETVSTGLPQKQDVEPDHHSSVMRNILAMLVPPRAFGRRHLGQVETPFSEMAPHHRSIMGQVLVKPILQDN